MTTDDEPGLALPGGCRVTHGQGARIRRPFADQPLTMHELHPGSPDPTGLSFRGQFGFIAFSEALRLPRHIHMSRDGRLLPERILVLNGAGLVELNGALYIIPPGSLVDIAPGVPHTWTACPTGIALPDGSATDGTFLMIYCYSEPTSFSPIGTTATLSAGSAYVPYTGDVEAIRIPRHDAATLLRQARCVWDRDLRSDLRLSSHPH